MSTTNVYIPSCADFKTNLRKASPAAGSCLLKSDDKGIMLVVNCIKKKINTICS